MAYQKKFLGPYSFNARSEWGRFVAIIKGDLKQPALKTKTCGKSIKSAK